MTQALSRANWSGVPSLNQPWLVALLRMIAMLVANVAATFRTRLAVAERRRRMLASLLAGDWHTAAKPRDLPGETHDMLEKKSAVAHSQATEALILRAHAVRVSKDEGELTAASYMLASMGVSFRKLIALSGTYSSATTHAGPWVPALRRFAPPAGMTATDAAGVLLSTRAPASS